MFAAKAGASKVYAVEATNMAVAARKLIEHNKVRGGNLAGWERWGRKGIGSEEGVGVEWR